LPMIEEKLNKYFGPEAVDGKYEKKEGAAKAEYTPRSPEELAQIESLIRTAAGIDTARGDVVTVQSAPFDTSAYEEMAAEVEGAAPIDLRQWIAYGGMVGLALLLFLFVLRPAIGWITRTSADLQELQTFPQTVEQLENQLGMHVAGEGEIDYRAKLKELIASDPKATAEMMREWLKARR
ncbi:MAG: hypothetical protein HQK87_01010, partial [Nitrospinae bacterium]|nr:hypothetical protein [Nitrospinota bacterium]